MDTPKEDEIDIPTSLALSEDEYTFWYTVTDSAGNVSNNSANFVMNVDLTAPSVSVAPDLVDDGNGDGFNEYDTGTSNTDNVTNLETVKFRITGLSLADNSVIIVDTGADPDSDVVEVTIDNTNMEVFVDNISTTTYAAKVTDAARNHLHCLMKSLLLLTILPQM